MYIYTQMVGDVCTKLFFVYTCACKHYIDICLCVGTCDIVLFLIKKFSIYIDHYNGSVSH